MITQAMLHAFIDREQEFNCKAWEDRRKKPLWEQEESGELLSNLTLDCVEGELLHLTAPENESKFRRGDTLILRDVQGHTEVKVTFLEDRRSEQRMVVRLKNNSELPPQPWCLEDDLIDLSALMKKAVDRVYQDPAHATARKMLEDPMLPSYDGQLLRRFRQKAISLKLSEVQGEAFAHALSCLGHTTIKGPPGSGKTTVIARIVQQAVEDGLRVLVTAQTHKAVNNVLAAVDRLGVSFEVIKYGREDMAVELPESVSRVQAVKKGTHPFQGPGVVGAVLISAATLAEKLDAFDLVLCDEASQVTLPLAVCGLVAGKRWVFVGDERQLPPVIVAPHSEDPCATSIFTHLYAPGQGVMLTETYRMNRELTRWVSREFYDGKLRAYMASAMRRLKLQTADHHPLLDPKKPLVIGRVNHQGNQDMCEEEAALAALLVQELHQQHGLSLKDIGVIAPYRAQNRLIRTHIEALLGSVLERGEDGLLVDTVDRAQGQEREVVVVSMTTSDLDYASLTAKFLLGAERLNVSITRARTKCVVLLSPELLKVRSNNLRHVVLLNRLHRMFREWTVLEVPPILPSGEPT